MSDWDPWLKLLQLAPIAGAYHVIELGWRRAVTRAPPYDPPELEVTRMSKYTVYAVILNGQRRDAQETLTALDYACNHILWLEAALTQLIRAHPSLLPPPGQVRIPAAAGQTLESCEEIERIAPGLRFDHSGRCDD